MKILIAVTALVAICTDASASARHNSQNVLILYTSTKHGSKGLSILDSTTKSNGGKKVLSNVYSSIKRSGKFRVKPANIAPVVLADDGSVDSIQTYKHRYQSAPNAYAKISAQLGMDDSVGGEVEEYFPIHVMRIEDLLTYDELPFCQQADEDGKLLKVAPDDTTPIVFISHQYASKSLQKHFNFFSRLSFKQFYFIFYKPI